jgi:exodeoxyribonuclease-3
MKILSWNVNGVRAAAKKGLVDYLHKEKPDVAGFQELKAFSAQCPELCSPNLGFSEENWHSAEKPGYSGVGLFWKNPEWKLKVGMDTPLIDREGRVQVLDCGETQLVNVYIPNGAASEARHLFKMSFLDEFLKFLQKLDQKKPVILFGDLNIAHREIDIHDPVRLDGTSGFKREEREWMDRLASAGFVDSFREAYPTERDRYSWWSYRAGARQRNKGWRIDYFWVSDRIKSSVRRVEIEKDVLGSDHCPLLLEIS